VIEVDNSGNVKQPFGEKLSMRGGLIWSTTERSGGPEDHGLSERMSRLELPG
jgi:hypothetical protein